VAAAEGRQAEGGSHSLANEAGPSWKCGCALEGPGYCEEGAKACGADDTEETCGPVALLAEEAEVPEALNW
jgi:hypothetical protein